MTVPEFDAVIIGSGFGGLCAAVRLKQAGIDNFVILEKDAQFGGTWQVNTYPGCAVDIPSHMYSFSFAPNPNWTRRLASQAELLDYTRAIVRDFGLAPHLRLGTAYEGAQFEEEGGYWRLRTSAGPLTAKCVVSALGAMNRAALPALPGMESFGGPSFHSSRWNHDVDLRGKRVAVIGNGASAIQFVPQIAPIVAQLDVYQRTAQWIVPRHDRAIGPRERSLLARLAPLRLLYRAFNYTIYEANAPLYLYLPRLFRLAHAVGLRHLHRQVADPLLRRQLTPDYTMGCKRVLVMSDYYPALTRANVSLVTSAVAEVRANSIVGADGVERPVDVLIYATGFHVGHALGSIEVRGRGGKRLFEHDQDCYKGCAVAGFPNYFTVTGPNSGLGHNSMIYMIESSVNYVVEAIKAIRAQGLHSVDVKADVQRDFVATVHKKLRGTVWSSGCKSWYLDGRGRNYAVWPGFTFTYRWATRRFDIGNYIVRS
ncbi:NAD(P)/FAD-dependent oxidoreductase [Massilia sp. P8910]|uniref:flavin-containing monooxygenase n=1 Tax=Massilia antarctica TaxID=2765360 RepID=UPI0006BB819D|nr:MULTISPECIES: NAD(P)/FAD-dependent oxidoreductase [Massilia]MCE3604411.1 NAD(P)/FAD-dependent oxidoreductase [Massilia antarctica]MCY0913947.1 NAD(P)/FAD-dependent oxidoreductase [Massilia sp. H27-R4]CUI04317.1 Cyclohexanone monooxygenase [Janthinobacterium sp. CG23_2]CUU28103.1 Cyclohexanone monooxygenase [Janthinobacterium sp. CG23_2]